MFCKLDIYFMHYILVHHTIFLFKDNLMHFKTYMNDIICVSMYQAIGCFSRALIDYLTVDSISYSPFVIVFDNNLFRH